MNGVEVASLVFLSQLFVPGAGDDIGYRFMVEVAEDGLRVLTQHETGRHHRAVTTRLPARPHRQLRRVGAAAAAAFFVAALVGDIPVHAAQLCIIQISPAQPRSSIQFRRYISISWAIRPESVMRW